MKTAGFPKRFGRFVDRIIRDERGNTLAIFAAALIPMVAMIGGGVDMGRAYMVETRMQQACDAGVLAGRKATGTKTYGTAERARANELFTVNYPADYLQSRNTVFTTVADANNSTISGVASAVVPTLIMNMFGKETIDVSVDCSATQEVSNTDMTLVLDTTGSMDWNVSDGKGGMIKRIDALKAAVKSFYGIIAANSAGSTARSRFAIVPYAQSVNVGRLIYDVNPGYLVGGTSHSTVRVQTRRVLSYAPPFVERIDRVNSSGCDRFSDNQPISGVWSPGNYGYSTGQYATKSGEPQFFYVFRKKEYNSYWGICDRVATPYTYNLDVPNTTYSQYEYMPIDIDMYDYVRSLTTGTRVRRLSDFNYRTDIWDGCIEEAQTVASSSISYSSATKKVTPGGVYDLDIDLIPNSYATRWKPQWQNIMYIRPRSPQTDFDTWGQDTGRNCPKEAKKLAVISKTDFDLYVDALSPEGGTYHDAGMIWGGRLSSPDGIFASTVNAPAPNNGYVSRHLIFMTDGEPGQQPHLTSLYGVEWHDQKVVGSGLTTRDSIMAAEVARHGERLRAVCEAVKGKGIRIWVIVFESSLTSDLKSCASDNSSFISDNAASLNTAFVKIANSISELRIVQ